MRFVPINCCGNTRIGCHLHDDFDDLLAGETDVQSPDDMSLQLRPRVSHCGQRCNVGNFARFQIQLRAGIEVAIGEGHDELVKIRRDLPQGFGNAVGARPVDFCDRFQCTLISLVHRDPPIYSRTGNPGCIARSCRSTGALARWALLKRRGDYRRER